MKRKLLASRWSRIRWQYAVEWAIIVAVAYFYTANTLLDFDPNQLQQTGEHNEAATLPLLIEASIWRDREIPLWNHYMLTGFPFAGDFFNHLWNPVSTLPILIWGAINGTKVSAFLSFVIAGIGQWLLAHVFGVRGVARVWAGLLFMLSGGLALLWRSGWFELLIGMAWFPWCFAALWWALHRRDYTSLVLTTLCVAMVLTTAGGYYPFYLSVSLGVLTTMAVFKTKPSERWIPLRRTAMVGVLSAGLLGIMLVPLAEAYPHMVRRAGHEALQLFSQPIHYALVNYVVSEPDWNMSESLGSGLLWTWFYIGWLPFVGVALASAAFKRARWRRPALVTLGVLTVVLLAWHANRHTPVKYIYDLIPFLYNLRFPNRLLILAASPLIVVASVGLQYAFVAIRRWVRNLNIRTIGVWQVRRAHVRQLLDGLLMLVLLITLWDVFAVNQEFNFKPAYLDYKANFILDWLKRYDPDLYYIKVTVGEDWIAWSWTPATYSRQVPMINLEYARYVASQERQQNSGSPVIAKPRYHIAGFMAVIPPDLELVQDFGEYKVWRVPDALPFAFMAAPWHMGPLQTIAPGDVIPSPARYAGPNRIVVEAVGDTYKNRLVVLVSNFPGWRLFVDGQPAPIVPTNDYLGADALPGKHTYTFVYQPMSLLVGLLISVLTMLAMDGLIWFDFINRQKRFTRSVVVESE